MDNNNYFKISREFVEQYTRTNYRVIGKNKHSSIKPCYWLGQKLLTGRENRNCYKGYFGIKSELCIQNTPTYPFCNQMCVFCWRDIEKGNLGSNFSVKPDDPEYLISEMIRHQKNLIEHHFPVHDALLNLEISKSIVNFYWKHLKTNDVSDQKNKMFKTDDFKLNLDKSNNQITKAVLLLKNMDILKTDDLINYYLSENSIEFLYESDGNSTGLLDKFVTNENDIKNAHNNAMNPNHAAISLDGEPTLYPFIGEFVSGFRARKMTTFIVTNGTHPDILQKMSENQTLPTQMYLTLAAPDKEIYQKTCRPLEKDNWEKIQKTLKILSSLKTRTCIRITSVKNLNISDDLVDKYAKIILESQPNFVDIKGFTLEGLAMNINKRLKSDQEGSHYFPDFDYLMKFANKLEKKGEFQIIKTHEKSRDILLRVNWPKNSSIIITSNQI